LHYDPSGQGLAALEQKIIGLTQPCAVFCLKQIRHFNRLHGHSLFNDIETQQKEQGYAIN